MITRYALIAAGGLLAVLGVLYVLELNKSQHWQEEAQKYRLQAESQQARIEAQERAAEAHRIYVQRAEKERAEFRALRNEIEQMEGGDEALSDYLRGVSRRLYPSD